jgi:hypothetical protein
MPRAQGRRAAPEHAPLLLHKLSRDEKGEKTVEKDRSGDEE